MVKLTTKGRKGNLTKAQEGKIDRKVNKKLYGNANEKRADDAIARLTKEK